MVSIRQLPCKTQFHSIAFQEALSHELCGGFLHPLAGKGEPLCQGNLMEDTTCQGLEDLPTHAAVRSGEG